MTDFEEFEQKQRKPFDIGNAFNDAFEIYKKIALPAGSALLIISTILVIIAMVASRFLVNNPESLLDEIKNLKPENLPLHGKLIYMGVITIINVLTAPFIAGLLKMAFDADHNEEVKFSTIGYYVNSSRFIHIVLNVALLTLFNIGLDISLNSLLPGIGKFIGMLITIPLSILTFISLPLIIFRNLNAIEALSKSIQLISQKFFLVLVLFILVNILALTGFLALCIGIIFTLPIIYAMQYVIYKSLAE
ncbi:hypothetical protein NAT51_07520 [Flavobacterium amniphilum]|uniref:hypothetical protein n=1 Tax=Flavobacterium amniphilum TaxID=1834035 RepID=UPI00202AAA78|nr:hypothetical protein [Flavobacterium amniphilum]MCL9805365.1 hypothetical protein [Flavobacterium amniphilum]